jgi:hypothetical protein
MDVSGLSDTPASLILEKNTSTPQTEGLVGPIADWRREKSFLPTKIHAQEQPTGGTDTILTMLPTVPKFKPRTGLMAQPWPLYSLERKPVSIA